MGTDTQKDNVLRTVGNMANDRLMQVGKEVAQMAKDSKSEEELKHKLVETFGKNKTQLVRLRNEVLPVPMRILSDEKNWDLQFDADRMRLFRTSSKHHWNLVVSMDTPSSRRLMENGDNWGTASSGGASDVSESGNAGSIMD